jgi:hypothetical protein
MGGRRHLEEIGDFFGAGTQPASARSTAEDTQYMVKCNLANVSDIVLEVAEGYFTDTAH